MTSKAGHTAGPCVPSAVYPFMVECEVPGLADGYDSYVVAEAKMHSLIGRETAEANTHFIAEAFTVAHETGLTPRQLAERCERLEEAAKELLSYVTLDDLLDKVVSGTEHPNDVFSVSLGDLLKLRAAIAKATAGGA